MRRLACLPLVLLVAACGAPGSGSARVEVPAPQPAPSAAPAPVAVAAPAQPVVPIDERFATTREGTRSMGALVRGRVEAGS